jgi:hypothetical protein
MLSDQIKKKVPGSLAVFRPQEPSFLKFHSSHPNTISVDWRRVHRGCASFHECHSKFRGWILILYQGNTGKRRSGQQPASIANVVNKPNTPRVNEKKRGMFVLMIEGHWNTKASSLQLEHPIHRFLVCRAFFRSPNTPIGSQKQLGGSAPVSATFRFGRSST